MLDQWRIEHSVLVPKNASGGRVRDKDWLARTSLAGPNEGFKTDASAEVLASASLVYGQDSVTAGNTANGYTFYAGYVNGYVSYGAMVARHPGAKVMSITVRAGVYGVDVIDVEPGCCTFADTPGFIRNSTHPGMARPVVYCAAWQGESMVSYLAGYGFKRGVHYDLWSAHYTGRVHICAPDTCGYGSADMTQYASNAYVDSDVAYSYVFGASPSPVPTSYPVTLGASGPLVKALQEGLNKWASRTGSAVLNPVDSNFGPDTKAATVKAQVYFYERGVAAGTATQWLMDQLAYPLWPLSSGRQGLDVEHLQSALNTWNAGRIGFGANLSTDGGFGDATKEAAAKAQFYFMERGVAAGQVTQWLWGQLEAPLWPIKTGRQGIDVLNLQKNLNKWKTVLGLAEDLAEDGNDGSLTAGAVAKAQVHFSEHGVPAGECTENVYAKLEANPA